MTYLQTQATTFVTVEEAKTHLKIEYEDDDEYLKNLIAVATEQAEHHLKREIIFRNDDLALCKSVEEVPRSIKHFVLLVVGDLYAKRELSSQSALNVIQFFEHLLDPYVIYDRD